MSEPTPPPTPAPKPATAPGRSVARRIAPWVIVGLGLGAVLVWWRTSTPDGPTTLTGTRLTSSPFIGSQACRDCHPGESAAQSRSGHARTLRPTGSIELVHRKIVGRDVADPERPNVRWRYAIEDGSLVAIRTEGSKVRRFVLDYALGSGEHAMTFVSLEREGDRPPTGLEHRLTYFAHDDSLGLTPGHASDTPKPGLTQGGFRLPPRVVLDCLECHGTRTAPPKDRGLAPETLIPNITCERCHGPGRAHVEAARKSDPDLEALALPFGPGRETAEAQLRLCGRCHRLPEMLPVGSVQPDNVPLARFPSVGMSQSACYQKSAGAMSCTTCHDPHRRVSSDRAAYEATCRSCHPPDGRSPERDDSSHVKASACPINPRDDCLKCHMPRRDVGHGLTFSDHWIRVPDKDASADETR